MKSRLLLITSSLLGVVATRVVFQGTCDEPQPLCEHRCVAESPETYECLCREGHRLLDDGLSCVKEKEAETTATATSPVLSEALRFSPSTSFARFPSPESAYLETNLSIVFRFTELNDGLLLFGGAADGDDYLSLAVIGPNIMLRFDCGEGAIEDLYRGPFPENQWHTLNVSRKFCSRTEIQVDDKLKLIDKLDEFKVIEGDLKESVQFYKGISMDENIYVGGASLTIRELERKAGTTRNFQGCVRRVSVNEAVLFDADLRLNTAVNEAELERCNARTPPPPVSSPATATKGGIRPVIVQKELLVDDKPLLEIRSEEDEVENRTAAFRDGAFVSASAPVDVLEFLEVVLSFKSSSPRGLLFFWSDEAKFIAVFLRHGFVELLARMGADSVELRFVSLLGHERFQVEGQSWVESVLHGLGSRLSTSGQVFIGGHPGGLPSELSLLGSFHGCIQQCRVNGHDIPLLTETSRLTGVTRCGADPCERRSCNTGSCLASEDAALCSCIGRFGSTCELDAAPDAFHFAGNSYIEINEDDILELITGDSLQLALDFKLDNFTVNDEEEDAAQVLLYSGDGDDRGEFLELSINDNNQLSVSWNLGSGPVVLTHPATLLPQRWTTVQVLRDRRQITISVNDAQPVTTTAPASSEHFNADASLFVGARVGGTWPMHGLRGCVRRLLVSEERRHVDLLNDSRSLVNIHSCDL